jgi:hypothetical protein
LKISFSKTELFRKPCFSTMIKNNFLTNQSLLAIVQYVAFER